MGRMLPQPQSGCYGPDLRPSRLANFILPFKVGRLLTILNFFCIPVAGWVAYTAYVSLFQMIRLSETQGDSHWPLIAI